MRERIRLFRAHLLMYSLVVSPAFRAFSCIVVNSAAIRRTVYRLRCSMPVWFMIRESLPTHLRGLGAKP